MQVRKRHRKSVDAKQFHSNPTVTVDALTIPEIRRVLSDLAVPKAQWESLTRRDDLVGVWKQSVSAMQRVQLALDYRSVQLEGGKKLLSVCNGPFSRLSTQLLLSIVDFLGLHDTGRFARACSFLRIRLTLSLDGTPSPALANLKHLGVLGICDDQLMSRVFSRVSALQSLDGCVEKTLFKLPQKLKSIRLRNVPFRINVFAALGACRQLESLDLDFRNGQLLVKSIPEFSWPNLRSVCFRMLNTSIVSDLCGSPTPNVERLYLYDVETSISDLPRLWPSSLKTLHLKRVCNSDGYAGLRTSLINMTSLSTLSVVDECDVVLDAQQFPPNLTALRCSLEATGCEVGCLPKLRALVLRIPDLERKTWKSTKSIADRFPALESLGIEEEEAVTLSPSRFQAVVHWL